MHGQENAGKRFPRLPTGGLAELPAFEKHDSVFKQKAHSPGKPSGGAPIHLARVKTPPGMRQESPSPLPLMQPISRRARSKSSRRKKGGSRSATRRAITPIGQLRDRSRPRTRGRLLETAATRRVKGDRRPLETRRSGEAVVDFFAWINSISHSSGSQLENRGSTARNSEEDTLVPGLGETPGNPPNRTSVEEIGGLIDPMKRL